MNHLDGVCDIDESMSKIGYAKGHGDLFCCSATDHNSTVVVVVQWEVSADTCSCAVERVERGGAQQAPRGQRWDEKKVYGRQHDRW